MMIFFVLTPKVFNCIHIWAGLFAHAYIFNSIWHFQASIIIRRKESKAEELQEAREELAASERELRQRNSQAHGSDGGEVVWRDEVHCLECFFYKN